MMSVRVLVTWATRSGSTAEVADAIAAILRQGGLAVETRPVNTVENLEGYGAVVLGIPLYMMHLQRAGKRFLSAHRKELAARPVALFVLGPVHAKEEEFLAARGQLEKELRKFPWFAPIAQEVFGGKWDPAKLGLPFTLIPALRKVPAMDARDWTAIRAWADRLRQQLQPSAV